MIGGLLGWPIGLISAALTALLQWPIGARLGLAPTSRASAAAIYATAAAMVEVYGPVGVDGRGILLLTAAACLAVGNRWRNVLAVLLTAAAVLAAPVTAVGFLALLAGMVLAGALAYRFGRWLRWLLAAATGTAAAALAAGLADPELPLALPPSVLGVLTVWTLLVVGLLWQRMPWLRPLGVGLLSVLACCWIPGPDTDAVVVLAAAGGLLTAELAENYPRLVVRRAVAVTVTGPVLLVALMLPGEAPRSAPPPTGPAPVALLPEPAPGLPAPQIRPVTIAIPALGVTGPLEELTADPATGELAAPNDPSRAGWYAAGVVPGDAGPAVVGGHVDSRAGPGVFFGLRGLRPGDEIEIRRSDGRSVRFAVTGVANYPKAEFPTAAVYGPAPGPELRLVTCGGPFDRAERSYQDNVVVDAVMV